MSVVEINNVGAIDSIAIEMPDGEGGVKVLCGTSGAGKTTVLRALSGLLGSKDDLAMLSPKDGTDRGEIAGLGRSVKVGQRTQSAGSASVPHLGDRLDIATLVDPRLLDPVARTKVRVRCLVSIGGKKLKPEDLLGDKYSEFGQILDLDELRGMDDPIAMADKLKRQLDQLALVEERNVERKAGAAGAKRQEAGDMDTLNAVGDYSDVVAKHREAMLALSNAKQQKATYDTSVEANKPITAKIEAKARECEGLDLLVLNEASANAAKVASGLKARYEAAKAVADEAEKNIREAQKLFAELSKLRGEYLFPGEDVEQATLDELTAAESVALQNLQDAGSIQTRRAALAASIELQEESSELAKKAADLRLAAQQVQAEVQKALPAGPIQVQDGSLVVQHGKRRKAVAFDDLSTGERWKVAMTYAIAAVGEGGVIPLVQESWQALAPELQAEVAETCSAAKVWIITAKVTDGELRVEDLNSRRTLEGYITKPDRS